MLLWREPFYEMQQLLHSKISHRGSLQKLSSLDSYQNVFQSYIMTIPGEAYKERRRRLWRHEQSARSPWGWRETLHSIQTVNITVNKLSEARKNQSRPFCRFQRSLSLPDTLIDEAFCIGTMRQCILITVTNSVGVTSHGRLKKVMDSSCR